MSTTLNFEYGSVVLNNEQYSVVSGEENLHQRILASAGSGKTTTIAARIAWLLTKGLVNPEQIVLVTFSRNSARDMLQRVRNLVGHVDIWAGTFHALASDILSKVAGLGATGHLLMIDELPVCLLRWLHTDKGRKWVSGLRYIVVDEFQDINRVQWDLIKAMSHIGCYSIIVGDDAQNIYTWRGSSSNFLLDYHKVVSNVKDYQLKINYRSTEAIVTVANRLVAHIPTLEWKEEMVAHKKGGQKPEVLYFNRVSDEGNWISKKIDEYRTKFNGTIAVLSRNNGALNKIEEIFAHNGIKTRFLTAEGGLEHDSNIVDLTTFHGSKGLEWDVTFLISLNDDLLPSRKTPEEVIGERRLFYVACTRARKYMFFTYHGNERTISRFIREIGYKFLTFHGLAKYALSDYEGGVGLPSLKNLMDAPDGLEWQGIRRLGFVPWKESAFVPYRRRQFFPNGETWKIPEWADGANFESFIRLWIKRCLVELQGWQTDFKDIVKERMIFTIPIFKDDKPFWDKWSEEMDAMVRHFFTDTQVIPEVQYNQIVNLAKENGLEWSQVEAIEATKLLSKIRSQLNCLRSESYNLDDFTLSTSRRSVPTEYRLDCFRSWKRCVDKSLTWRECLLDIWRIGCLDQASYGRNAGLFRACTMKDNLEASIPFLEILERSLLSNFDINSELVLNPEFYTDDIVPVTSDFISGKTLVRICGEKKPDYSMWIEAWITAYLCFATINQTVERIQLIHPFYGLLWDFNKIDLVKAKGLYEILLKIWKSKN
jgi:hypothetical protein